ncbi:winged helix-turn-helix domain-containing protein [Phaeovulum vinaykumarii]|uniref:Molybdate transport system regulatory protein n=1 Tax=Phaeovulum vinaykumarii TaxID=407234 RepID=A0A1N7JME8_9RHOB|nr:LysR family transcriptional regulator [Phaeovulum vinaykumarii]SIS50477.1 molybdate transport system regulatory protein [Phaeovulum vinaykumarii]SOB90281.1 molybdate transport system regulatory protein [Phaeovulum vinaykumarii]
MASRMRIRLHFADGAFIGPGKADLMRLIVETGSISAAGRRMQMSYKRAWSLVDELNSMFAEPLVRASRGGAQGGGARLTPTGIEVLATYETLMAEARRGASGAIARLEALRRAPAPPPPPEPPAEPPSEPPSEP